MHFSGKKAEAGITPTALPQRQMYQNFTRTGTSHGWITYNLLIEASYNVSCSRLLFYLFIYLNPFY